jgi:hypothetical protein
MLTILPNFPDHVLAVAASDQVTRQDYRDVLEPEIVARLKKGKPLDFYYRLGADFTGFNAGGMWEDARVAIAHLENWGRIAIVTDMQWIIDAVRLFRPLFPHSIRIFGNAEVSAARTWITQTGPGN